MSLASGTLSSMEGSASAEGNAQGVPPIAVIGSGYWGKNLIRNFGALGALRLICDSNEALLRSFQQEYPQVDVCMALNDVLGRDDIQGVVVATPAETHYAIAREVLLAGKHAFVEKPLALGVDEGRELIQLAGQRQRVLMVGHLLQYHPAFLRLLEDARRGDLGRINYIYSHRLNLGKIRREENILWSFAPHDISMILALAGEAPEAVAATGGNYLHKKIADVTTTHIRFPSGLRAHLFVSWLHPFKEQKLVVVGEKKMAVFDDTQPWEAKLLFYPHEIRWQDNVPVPARKEPEKVPLAPAEPLRLECSHFLDSIRGQKTPRTNGAEGLRVLQVLNTAQQSMDRGGCELPCDAGLLAALPERAGSAGAPGGAQDVFIHPTAEIDAHVSIGAGTRIWHFSHVLSRSAIGTGCNIGQNVVIGPDVSVGDHCKIQNNVSVYKGVTLEDGVFCGPSMVFTNIYNPRAEIRKMDQVRPTLVRQGATIGANATVVCGVTLGRYSFVGAGAVVNRSVADHALVAGNPARQIGWVCECGERLTDDLDCLACRLRYRRGDSGLQRMDE